MNHSHELSAFGIDYDVSPASPLAVDATAAQGGPPEDVENVLVCMGLVELQAVTCSTHGCATLIRGIDDVVTGDGLVAVAAAADAVPAPVEPYVACVSPLRVCVGV
eukprot:COSAG02_NODE_20017_length_852_cov_0.879150_1_plen_106_part_00